MNNIRQTMRILKNPHSEENFKRGIPFGIFNIHSVAKNQKIEGDSLGH